MTECMTCWPSKAGPAAGCVAVPPHQYRRLVVEEHGRVRGRDAMMAEIYSRGPISCAISATQELDDNWGPGVFKQYYPNPDVRCLLCFLFVFFVGANSRLTPQPPHLAHTLEFAPHHAQRPRAPHYPPPSRTDQPHRLHRRLGPRSRPGHGRGHRALDRAQLVGRRRARRRLFQAAHLRLERERLDARH